MHTSKSARTNAPPPAMAAIAQSGRPSSESVVGRAVGRGTGRGAGEGDLEGDPEGEAEGDPEGEAEGEAEGGEVN